MFFVVSLVPLPRAVPRRVQIAVLLQKPVFGVESGGEIPISNFNLTLSTAEFVGPRVLHASREVLGGPRFLVPFAFSVWPRIGPGFDPEIGIDPFRISARFGWMRSLIGS